MSEMQEVGNRLRQWRESAKLTRPALSEKIGVAVGTIRNHETGISAPKTEHLLKLALLGCDVGWLLTGRQSEQAASQSIAARSTSANSEADAILDEIEEKLQAAESVPFDVTAMLPEQSEMYQTLQRIASSAVDDIVRARADLYLRLAWADPNASARYKSRETAVFARMRRAGEVVSRAEAAVGWTPPMLLRDAMKALVFEYGVSEDSAREALDMIHIAWKRDH